MFTGLLNLPNVIIKLRKMKLTIRFWTSSVLIIFRLFLLHDINAQDFNETINFADSQLKSGNLSSALKTYQRAIFFSEGRNNLYLFTQVAEISYSKNDFETAQKYYGLAFAQSGNDSLKTELLFKKAYCQILNKNYHFAIIDLFSVSDTSIKVQNRLNFYLGTCYFGLQDFKAAQISFLKCIDESNTKELADLFSDKKLYSPSPKTARILSMILPGAGQFYSGDVKSGFNSLLLTSGLVALGINIALRYQPIDAIVAILPWYQRYFTGGYDRAEEIAIKKRATKRNEIYLQILELVGDNINRE
jgi:tetratricopeptide (TPR) repeat protein